MKGKEYIYISGPISGINDYKERFAKAKKKLEAQGFSVCNPVDLDSLVKCHFSDPTWVDYMKIDIRFLCVCDSIFMLKGWENSRGAKLEHHIAQELGMKIYYEEDRMSFHPETEKLINKACVFEFAQATETHGMKFHSMHEGWAVLKEEVEEAQGEFNLLNYYLGGMWISVKQNEEVITKADFIQKVSIKAMMELAQIWAVCEKMKGE